MNPLPPEVIARWSPMWPKDCHPDRPWWTLCVVDGEPVQTSFPPRYVMQWRRVDGKAVRVGYQSANPDWRTTVFQHEAEIAAIDAAHPLPAPPPMAQQVWSWGPGNAETAIVHVHTGKGRVLWATGGETGPEHWPPPYAILVYGPSCYGVVPWGPG